MRGGWLVGEHLYACGCRNVAIITWSDEAFEWTSREAGFVQALEAHGVEVPHENRIKLSGAKPSRIEAAELVGELLDSGLPFDGIFARSDRAASGVLQELRKRGISVPDRVKLVGYDDSIYSRLTTPGITTVNRSPAQLARKGCEALLKLIAGEELPLETTVPVELVVRGSTVAGHG